MAYMDPMGYNIYIYKSLHPITKTPTLALRMVNMAIYFYYLGIFYISDLHCFSMYVKLFFLFQNRSSSFLKPN